MATKQLDLSILIKAKSELDTEIKKAAAQMDDLRKEAIKDNTAIAKSVEQTQAAYKAVDTQIEQLNAEIDKLGKTSEDSGKRSSTGIAKIGDAAKSVNSSLGSVATAAAATGAALVTLFAVTGLKSAADFEQAMRTLASRLAFDLKNLTEEQSAIMTALAAEARRVGEATEFTSTEAARGLETLAAAGLSAQQSLSTLAVVADFATSNNITLAESSELIIGTTNALNRTFDDLGNTARRTADILTIASNQGATTSAEVAAAIAKVGIKADEAGLSAERLAASVAILANNSIKAEEAGTQLRVVMRDLTNESSQFGKELLKNGINARDFTEVMAFLREGLLGQSQAARVALREMNAYGQTAAAIIALKWDSLTIAEQNILTVEKASATAAANIRGSLLNTLEVLKSAFDSIQLNVFTPALGVLSGELQKLSDKFVSLSKNKEDMEQLSTAVTALIGNISGSIQEFSKDFDPATFARDINSGFYDAGRAIRGFSEAVDGSLSAVKLAFNGISLIAKTAVAGILESMTLLLKFSLLSLPERLQESFAPQIAGLKGAVTELKISMGDDLTDIENSWDSLGKTTEQRTEEQKAAATRLKDTYDTVTTEIKAAQVAVVTATEEFTARASLAILQHKLTVAGLPDAYNGAAGAATGFGEQMAAGLAQGIAGITDADARIKTLKAAVDQLNNEADLSKMIEATRASGKQWGLTEGEISNSVSVIQAKLDSVKTDNLVIEFGKIVSGLDVPEAKIAALKTALDGLGTNVSQIERFGQGVKQLAAEFGLTADEAANAESVIQGHLKNTQKTLDTLTEAQKKRQGQLADDMALLGITFDAVSDKATAGGELIVESYKRQSAEINNQKGEVVLLKAAIEKLSNAEDLKLLEKAWEESAKAQGIATNDIIAGLDLIREKTKEVEDAYKLAGNAGEEALLKQAGLMRDAGGNLVVLAKSTKDLAAANKEAAPEVKRVAEEVKQVAVNTEDAASATTGLGAAYAAMIQVMRDRLGALSEAAEAAFVDVLQGVGLFNNALSENQKGLAATRVEMGNLVQDTLLSSRAWKQFGDTIYQSLAIREQFFEQSIRADNLEAALNRVTTATQRDIAATESVIDSLDLLDSATLDGLRRQLDTIRQETQALSDDITSTLDNLRGAIDSIKGDDLAAENRRFEEERLKLQKQFEEVRGTADEFRVAEALRLNNELHQLNLKNIKEEADERKLRDAEVAARKKSDAEQDKKRQLDTISAITEATLQAQEVVNDAINTAQQSIFASGKPLQGAGSVTNLSFSPPATAVTSGKIPQTVAPDQISNSTNNTIIINVDGKDLLSEAQIRAKVIPVLNNILRRA